MLPVTPSIHVETVLVVFLTFLISDHKSLELLLIIDSAMAFF